MSESNKPDWGDAPEWAKWLACDGVGKYMCQWWWFPNKPEQLTVPGIWWSTGISSAKFSGKSADTEWAKNNWQGSLEERPAPKPKNEYLTSPSKKRVTLFIEFDGQVHDDKTLSRNVSEMICNRLNGEHTYSGDKFTPGGASVGSIRIAIGTCKTDDISFDEEAGYYIKEDTDE